LPKDSLASQEVLCSMELSSLVLLPKCQYF